MSSWTTRTPNFVQRIGLRILEFLHATCERKLTMTPHASAPRGIVIYTDSSFSPYGGHSMSGVLVQYRGRDVLWKSRRQSIVCLSTAEAELVAACEGVVLGQSVEALVNELSSDLSVKQLLVDNVAAIVLAEGGGHATHATPSCES